MTINATPPNSNTAFPLSTSGPGNSPTKSLGTAKPGLADNFETFLSLLTTQLRNQNPLDPLNVNQFTQQLVQFAQVEQQLRGNKLLTTLVDTQKTVQSTQALAFVGTTAVVDGSAATLTKGSAIWTLQTPKKVGAVVSVTNAAGQTIFSSNRTLAAGANSFAWDGRGDDGRTAPDGIYKLTVTAKERSDETVPISTEVQGTVDSVDLTASPILLSIGGQRYTMDKIKRVVQPSSDETSRRL
ncbi:flagellar biosynthesis protein FlgD [Bradyrhizobium liaoningense]|uniref:flagellar hook assembly protein FlgD n=1 Tax=Bradyrhizobium liaoningense TaxID=43992 RepID=UPI001BAD3D1A|nr:flagellar hook capping FlgD N-terminal domain-containing protein [Bradyrhizobium liaoningense]MBR0843309.1 flagellar biosynthesis protein FlgD [Bradyrhizobium liaoningense]MBR0856955.1 flagellar biosynthesis protein FlgD [Bradyrhizobium liaoningense]